MIPVDLSANCEGWIYDPNGSGIQILGIRSRDPFSGSTDMSGSGHQFHNGKKRAAQMESNQRPPACNSTALAPCAIYDTEGGDG